VGFLRLGWTDRQRLCLAHGKQHLALQSQSYNVTFTAYLVIPTRIDVQCRCCCSDSVQRSAELARYVYLPHSQLEPGGDRDRRGRRPRVCGFLPSARLLVSRWIDLDQSTQAKKAISWGQVFQITDAKPVVCASVGARILRAPGTIRRELNPPGQATRFAYIEATWGGYMRGARRRSSRATFSDPPGREEQFGMIRYSLD
jgi:hypothetical protein